MSITHLLIGDIDMKKVTNKLRVLHYPQVPCNPFIVDVKDEEEAYKITQVLAYQHLWLFENKIIPDYANSICVVMFDKTENEWVDYYNELEGMEWDEIVETYISN